MKKIFLLIISTAMFFQCSGQIKVQDEDFAKFVNNFTELKLKTYPTMCKPILGDFFYFKENSFYEISMEESKKYLGYLDKDYYVTVFDYNMDEDKISNIRQVKNPPFANNRISDEYYIALIYLRSSSLYLNECDTAIEVFHTFTLDGKSIDKITIQGHYTREFDWKDVVFIKKNILRIFDYKTNLDNYNIKGGTYYIIDEKQAKTVVEINDYQIDENGKINLIKTHPKKYLKKFASFYRSYHKDSDDPMNEY